MDDGFRSYLTSLAFCFGLTLALTGHAIELEYVSPSKQKELETEFARADFSNGALVKHKEWTCEMYGMRSRLQIKRGVRLYHWKEVDGWHNQGSQVISDYSVQGRVLEGSSGALKDQVKLTAGGQLISKLTVSKPKPAVIAYSVCSTP